MSFAANFQRITETFDGYSDNVGRFSSRYEKETLDSLIEKAHIVCPYSNATRNNVDVELKTTV